MKKLLISEITRMGPGFCVIGLEHEGQAFRSLRPLPPRVNAWRTFPHKRGDILQFYLSTIPNSSPHVEDRFSTGVLGKASEVSEGDLVNYLRQAERAEELKYLFQCPVRENPGGSGMYVEPNSGSRSICGCDLQNIRFRVFPRAVRATLLLLSGETLRDLPLVDRDWNEFIERALQQAPGANRLQRLHRFLNETLATRVLADPKRFARIGLSRLHNKKHWLMLDSLFPLPQPAWLDPRSEANSSARGTGAMDAGLQRIR